jgi:hypothetical protein
LGGRDWFKASPDKMLLTPHPITTNQLDVVVHICDSGYSGGIGRMITIPDHPRQKTRPYLEKKNLQSKRDRDKAQVAECQPTKHKEKRR